MSHIQDSTIDWQLTIGRRNLRKQAISVVASFPSGLIYSPDDITTPTVDGPTLRGKLRLKLEHLQNLFLIERLLSKQKGGERSSELFEISLEMVSLALICWTCQKRLDSAETCLDWVVVYYAAPAGGVLCMELLNWQTPDAWKREKSRATVIERLNLLVGFFDWILPSAPNYDICKNIQRVVRQVIEQSLDISTNTTLPGYGFGDGHMDASADLANFFSLDLLDTFDWSQLDGTKASECS